MNETLTVMKLILNRVEGGNSNRGAILITLVGAMIKLSFGSFPFRLLTIVTCHFKGNNIQNYMTYAEKGY